MRVGKVGRGVQGKRGKGWTSQRVLVGGAGPGGKKEGTDGELAIKKKQSGGGALSTKTLT